MREWRLKVMVIKEKLMSFGSPGPMGCHSGGLSHGRVFV